VGADGTTGPAWTFLVVGGWRRGQMKGQRWSCRYDLKSPCRCSLDVAMTRQEKANTGPSQLQRLG